MADVPEDVPTGRKTPESHQREVGVETDSPDVGARTFDLPSFEQNELGDHESRISFLGDVNLHVKVELGRSRMYVEDVLRLNEGSVVELDKPAGDPVDIYVNDRHIARGEVLVVNDNFCVRISEIVQAATSEET